MNVRDYYLGVGANCYRVRVSALTSEEKDKLLQALVDHIGRDIEVTEFDGEAARGVNLVSQRC